jgi:hypothetical protein
MDSSYHPEWKHIHDYHGPKRLQAFEEMKRLIDCGQIETKDYAEARADFDWHNRFCLSAVLRYSKRSENT